MSRRLHRDLDSWASGETALKELELRHPGAGIASTAALHMRLTSLAEAPTPDLERAWTIVSARIADRATPSARARRVRRPVAAAIVAAVLVGPTAAYAAAPDAVRSVVGAVTALLPGVDDTSGPTVEDDENTDEVPATGTDPNADQQDDGQAPSDESDESDESGDSGAPGSDDSVDRSPEGDDSPDEDGVEPPSSGSDPEPTTTSTTEPTDSPESPEPG